MSRRNRRRNKACPVCGKRFTVPYGLRRQVCCGARCAQAKRARDSAEARGDAMRFKPNGKYKSGQNPYPAWKGDRAHRTVAREKLGRDLRPSEIVHHVNEDKRDFRPTNLYVCSSPSEHGLFHREFDACQLHACGRPHKARGLCAVHYERWRTTGNVYLPDETPHSCTWLGCPGAPGRDGLCDKHRRALKGATPF